MSVKKIYLNEEVFNKLIQGDLYPLQENRLGEIPVVYDGDDFIAYAPLNFPKDRYAIHDKEIPGQTYLFDFDKGVFLYGSGKLKKEKNDNHIDFTSDNRLSNLLDFLINKFDYPDYKVLESFKKYGVAVGQSFRNSSVGLLDSSGQWLIEPEYLRIAIPEVQHNEGDFIVVTNEMLFGIYNAITQEWVYEPIYNQTSLEIDPYWNTQVRR